MTTIKKSISILGATGSIGTSTLRVIEKHPDLYDVFAVSAYSQLDKLVDICAKFEPRYAVVPSEHAKTLAEKIQQKNNTSKSVKPIRTEIITDAEGLRFVASHDEVDMIMAAIVGAAGLDSTYAAITAGKKVLLANKETLVMTGALMMDAVVKHQAQIIPVDSEHNAIFQSMPQQVMKQAMQFGNGYEKLNAAGVSHISLTASGGPFRTWSKDELITATADDACKHPTFKMGRKISVDSATLMNKGLELIEACYLFDIPEHKINIIIHPESVMHSAVHYTDGGVLAQLGNPDMCTPIAHAMAWPNRISSDVKTLDFVSIAKLNFYEPDYDKFPCLGLARQAMQTGRSAPTVLNAANEVAVASFLQGSIGFMDIVRTNTEVLSQMDITAVDDIDSVMSVDKEARALATQYISAF